MHLTETVMLLDYTKASITLYAQHTTCYHQCSMWHPTYHTGKTVRFKAQEPRHKDAIPYKRAEKHKMSVKDYQ